MTDQNLEYLSSCTPEQIVKDYVMAMGQPAALSLETLLETDAYFKAVAALESIKEINDKFVKDHLGDE